MRIIKMFFFLMMGCLILCLTGCGGGGSVGVEIAAAPHTEANVMAITIDAGPISNTVRAHNVPFVSVKICVPGSAGNCQTINHIILDTGSTGLRVVASALSPAILGQLPQVSINNFSLTECMHFFDGYAWGSIKNADVQLGGYTVSNMALQVIGDSTFNTVPSSCTGTGSAKNSVETLGANGILGIGGSPQDCGSACTSNNTVYYGCSSPTSCQNIAVTTTQQLQHPIAQLSADNNGTLIQLPSLNSGVGSNITGTLIFGIATQSNNTPASTPTLLNTQAASNYGFTGTLGTQAYRSVYIDSGSTDWVFDDNGTMPICGQNTIAPGFYCPASTQSFALSIVGANNTTASASFSIGDASALFANILATNYTAFNNTGFPANDVQKSNAAHTTFIAGLPFFYGKSVWTAIDGVNSRIGTGPFVAYQ